MKLNFHENHRLLFGVVFLGFVLLSIIVAVGPAIWVEEHNHPLPGSEPLSEQAQRGFQTYIAEGCAYCHTQQVRPLKEDQDFGRPSTPGDYARLQPLDFWRMTPEILGTERTGPDLSNIGNRQSSATWHYIHFYNPRAVVKSSVMQAYPWLFRVKENPDSNDVVVPVPKAFAPAQGKVVATQKAQDLVAYVLSLKQVSMPGMKTAAETTATTQTAMSNLGARVFSNNCASCHQANGQGVPGTFPPLKGDPVVTASDPTQHIRTVLFGLQGKTINGTSYATAMPAQANTLSNKEIAAVINHERTSWGNKAPTVTPQQVDSIRSQGPQGGGQ